MGGPPALEGPEEGLLRPPIAEAMGGCCPGPLPCMPLHSILVCGKDIIDKRYYPQKILI